MSKSIKLINEGFLKKYMKEELQSALEKEVKKVLTRHGYDISVEGADNFISAAAEYIDMSRDYQDGDYSVEEWLHDTELNYPEELEFMKSLEESTSIELGPFKASSDLGTTVLDTADSVVNKVVDNAAPIAKAASAVIPLLADDASEKKQVFHNDNGEDYEVIERSKSGENALLNKGKQWIVAWNCPKENEGSWGQGHYFFDEKEAREVWEDKYLNENLDDSDYNDLKSDFYNALSGIVYEYQIRRGLDISRKDIENAIEWFETHFFDDEFEESLKEAFSIVDLDTGDRFGNYDTEGVARAKAQQYCSLFNAKCAVVDDNFNLIAGFNKSGKEIKNESLQPLKEARWAHQLKSGYALRQAIDAEDYDAIKSRLMDCYKEIHELIPDDFDDYELDNKLEELEILDTEPDPEIDIDEDDVEDNWNYELSDFYDLCDAFKIWIPLEESFSKKLKECVLKLNEAEMSDEDKKDSEILWNIYNKTQQRANAALTPEEKAVLNKYDLRRSSDNKNIFKNSETNSYLNDGPIVTDRMKRNMNKWRSSTKQSDVNLADKARKIRDRGPYGYSHTLNSMPWSSTIYSDDHREYTDSEGRYRSLKDKGLLDRERADQNANMTADVSLMKQALKDRKYHKANVDKNDAEYDAKKAAIEQEYQRRLADNERNRQWSGEYHQKELDRAKGTVDRLLRKDKE